MSGPGLNQRDAHHAIHQAAFHDAERLTLLLRQALRAGDQQQALQIAAVLIEQWQTRTLRHADAEETGWYRDLLAERPELHDDVIALTRDHDLLRILLAEIQGILSARGIASGVVERFEAMLLLNGIHSRTEEQRLLGGADEDAHEAPDRNGDPRKASPSITPTSETSGRDNSGTAPSPLAIARPALYARLSALLRERGLNPTDILAELRTDAAGQAILYVAFGQGYQRTMEWPLPLPEDRDGHDGHDGHDGRAAAPSDESSVAQEAEDAMLRQIAEACEQATQADYHTRMRTPG